MFHRMNRHLLLIGCLLASLIALPTGAQAPLDLPATALPGLDVADLADPAHRFDSAAPGSLATLKLAPRDAKVQAGDEPPAPLDGRALDNLTAFANLLGYVRFFHAGDGVAAMSPDDWHAFTMAGIETVEDVDSRWELAATLNDLFGQVAPGVLVVPKLFGRSADPELADKAGDLRLVSWWHRGVDLGPQTSSVYQSRRVDVGRPPEVAVASAYQPIDPAALSSQVLTASAHARAHLNGPDAYAEMTIIAYSPSGPSFYGAPVTASWATVELEVELPADTYAAYLTFDLYDKGTLDFDDIRLTADGLDVSNSFHNPDMELRQEGFPTPGWAGLITISAVPYEIESRGDNPPQGDWYARIDGPQALPVSPPVVRSLGGGVRAIVPVAMPADDEGTFPRIPADFEPPTPDKPPSFVPTPYDRTTRLAAVMAAWTPLRHFYPYFDVVDTDWDAALGTALTQAAIDSDPATFTPTLQRLIAALDDGHGQIVSPYRPPQGFLPLVWDWVEDQLVVTTVTDGGVSGLAPGDKVLTIDGVPAGAALAAEIGLHSGATDGYLRYLSLIYLRFGELFSTVELEVEPYAGGGPVTVNVTFEPTGLPAEPRPPIFAELEPGIFYADLDRMSDADFYAALDDLATADGVIFDLRGYPGVSPRTLGHLLDSPVTSAWWFIPEHVAPGDPFRYQRSHWTVLPGTPAITGKRVFLTDGQAISYAETYLGIVEANGLADIVGDPTAGTNGNINVSQLPGGYYMIWTGMKVLKHDGIQHHGVGIQPTVPASRTRAGVAQGLDEVLLEGLAVVKSP